MVFLMRCGQIVRKDEVRVNRFWFERFRLAAIFGELRLAKFLFTEFLFAKFPLIIFPIILMIRFSAAFVGTVKKRFSPKHRRGVAWFNRNLARFIRPLRQFHPNQFFNIPQKGFFAFRAEGNRYAFTSRPRGSTNAMDITFRNIRQVNIDDMRNIVNINAATSNICCHQHRDFTIAELPQRTLPLPLAFIAMERHRQNSIIIEECLNPICAKFGANKNNRPIHLFL